MKDDERAVLEVESERGERARAAWDTFIEPFFVAKTEQLFGAFIALPTTKADDLLLVKMQANALESLRDELQGHINTGKLASKAIKDEDDANRE